SPIGITPADFWASLAAGRSGVGPLAAFPATHLPTACAAEVRDFTGAIDDFGPLEGEMKKAVRKALKMMCRECQMGVAAAMRAIHHGGLKAGTFDPERVGVCYGADYMLSEPAEFADGMDLCGDEERKFHFEKWGAAGLGKMNPLWLLKYLPNMPACHIAIFNDLRGPNNSLTQREASSNLAIGEAARTIQRGSADVMLAGATGTRVHLMKSLQALVQEETAEPGVEPQRASRPFDLNRTGMVIGEGAGCLVLEELGHAQARGATILAEVLGGGASFVADRNHIANRPKALANAMRAALRDAGLKPEIVSHLHAHGLSTRRADVDEAAAIADVFGPAAMRLPVTAAKSYFGNLGAASGIVELAASILALHEGRLFPVLNYDTPDPACPVAAVRGDDVPAGRIAAHWNVTPQGQASAVIVGLV
ncbi:MAG: beta-ketoacyl synthase, partial [Pirellulales bacterium]